MEDLVKRFDVDLSGRIEFGNGEFLGVIASIAVASVQDIDDFVFSAAFRTFDHVSMHIAYNSCSTDHISLTDVCSLVVKLNCVPWLFYLAHLWTDFQPCLLYLGQKVFIKSLIMMIVKISQSSFMARILHC